MAKAQATKNWQIVNFVFTFIAVLGMTVGLIVIGMNQKDISDIESDVKFLKNNCNAGGVSSNDIKGLSDQLAGIKNTLNDNNRPVPTGIMGQFDELNLQLRKGRKVQIFYGCIERPFDAQGGSYPLTTILPFQGASTSIRMPFVSQRDTLSAWDSMANHYAIQHSALYTLTYHFNSHIMKNHTQLHAIVKKTASNPEVILHVDLVTNNNCFATTDETCSDDGVSRTINVDYYLEEGDVVYGRSYAIVSQPSDVGSDQGQLILAAQCGSNYFAVEWNQPDKQLSV
jgi:hypothetical protein